MRQLCREQGVVWIVAYHDDAPLYAKKASNASYQ
jgi:hypothetical protein